MEAAKKLESELKLARKSAEEGKVAAEKAKTDLEAVQKTNKGLESRVTEVKNLLQEASTKFEALEIEKKEQDLLVTRLTKASEEDHNNARPCQQEIEVLEEIAAGKPLFRLMHVRRLVESRN
jgi:hypothetical protein